MCRVLYVGVFGGCAACASAYSADGGAAAIAVCQSGCKRELPAVDNRQHQVSSWQYKMNNLTVCLFVLHSAPEVDM